ncbi:hypothetical protein ABOM_011298 [Aspergillus bombycis]|uniref:Uncharacterized protein n=1 Tax=Aspergillus bombycis TaxID=109264 RepID=A0A1F7ZL25_9EURO|nr:hypothetical protein ABOM_011298 [Aspergillus bombycis]OGM40153.1 hypothetical protein ABOM_011298 [Aspergillus bombycis]
MSEIDPISTFVTDSEGRMAAEYEQVEALVEHFSKLAITESVPCSSVAILLTESLSLPMWLLETQLPAGDTSSSGDVFQTAANSQATVVSSASVDTPTFASIFSEDAPVCPSMDIFGLLERVQQRPHTLFDSIPIMLSSIYGEPYGVGGPLAEEPELILGPLLCPAGAESADPSLPRSTPSTRVAGLLPTWFPAILSPLPEELEPTRELRLSAGPCYSSGGPQEDLAEKSTAPLVRAHEETSDEDRTAPVTPAANKRRNLGPPGSTPFANRRTPLSRRIQTRAAPFSARLARREAEKHGRIESTLFRLPDYLRQLEADRQNAEKVPSSPSPRLPQTTFDFTMEPSLPTNQSSADESSALQEPSTPGRNTPETPQRGWNLRGLLSSVPRSFSRLLPFRRPSESSEDQSTIEPSSERITRTRSLDPESAGPQTEGRSRWRLSEGPSQPPKKRARNLSYSLFPAPIDRSLYLGDIPKPSTVSPEVAAPDSHHTEQAQAQKPEPQQTAASGVQAEEPETSQASSDAEQRKRKRSPSPDVIPNPAGSSYGLDLDYFCYSSESEDEAAETPSKQSERKKADGLAKSVARSALRTDRQSSKKVRFDASPEDTPSKLRSRARATDPYRGTHFVGMGNDSPTPSARTEQPSQRHPGFVPNTQGTFQLDYDAASDDSETTGLSSSTNVTAPSPSQAAQEEDGHDAQSPASRHASRAHPSTPGKVDEEALARVRSQAEKYKPKTPSGLRTASRYASPLTATPDTIASNQTTKKSDLIAKPAKVDEPENFGDDEFARDAEWLYQNCPSGDLSQLRWPARQSYEESLGVSSTSMQLLATIWDDSEIEPAYLAFRQSFEEFKRTLK